MENRQEKPSCLKMPRKNDVATIGSKQLQAAAAATVKPYGARKDQNELEATPSALVTARICASDDLDMSTIKPTKKRYLILLLFCLHSAINAAQWIYLSTITSTVSKYYQVNNMAVNWTSMIYMVMYIPLVVPSSWLFEKIGMRNSILLGSLGTSLGSIIKCFACNPARFNLLMLGQALVAISQLFVLSVPPRLAAVWFPDHQVSLANACGVFGNQLGIGLGFVVPQLVLDSVASIETTTTASEDSNLEETGVTSGLFRLFSGVALFSTLVSLLIMLFFDQAPLRPPGLARLQKIKQETASAEAGIAPLVLDEPSGEQAAGSPGASSKKKTKSMWQHGTFGTLLCDLFTDANFVLLMASYGLNVGVFYAISTVLNQMISPSWPDANTLVGRLGLMLVIAGMFGSVISGLILDKTRMFRLVNAGLYLMTLISMCAFALTLELHSPLALHLAVISLGYFMTGYLFIGYEMSNEITWPRPESVTAGLLNLAAQVFGVTLTYSSSYVVDHYGNLAANVYLIVSLALGLMLTLLIRTQLRRQSAMVT